MCSSTLTGDTIAGGGSAALPVEGVKASVLGRVDALDATPVCAEKRAEVATLTEVRAWYVYDWANSPFFQVADVLFVVLLNRMAEDSSTFPRDALLPGAYSSAVRTVNNIAQVLVILSFSALGDYGTRRKTLLKTMTFAGAGVLLAVILCSASADLWWLAGALRVAGGCCFVLATVYYNAYLPLLASAHYEAVDLDGEAWHLKEAQIADEMSSKGMIVGYAGGASMASLAVVVLAISQSSVESDAFQKLFWLCLCISVVGIWWVGFGMYTLKHLKTRPGQSLPEGSSIFLIGWKQVAETLCVVVKHWHTLLFIIAYFFLSDALATFYNLAPLVLSTLSPEGGSDGEKNAPADWYYPVMVGVLGPVVGALGGIALLKLQQRFGIPAKTMILAEVCALIICAVACALGMITDTLTYIIALAPLAFTAASIQANCRSLFSNFAPRGMESAMFAFYALTDKGSAVVGPQVTVAIYNATEDYTSVFWYVVAAFLFSFVVLALVDVQKGIEDSNCIGTSRGDDASNVAAPTAVAISV